MLRSERIVSLLAVLALLVAAMPAAAQSRYKLGQKATPEQIAGAAAAAKARKLDRAR